MLVIWQQVGVQAGVGAGPAEGLLVQVRRAGGHHHAGEAFLLDVLLDHLLAERGAHELVVAGDGHVLEVLAGPLGDLLDVDRAGDVAAAVTNVDADFLGHDRFSEAVVSCQLSVASDQPRLVSPLLTGTDN